MTTSPRKLLLSSTISTIIQFNLRLMDPDINNDLLSPSPFHQPSLVHVVLYNLSRRSCFLSSPNPSSALDDTTDTSCLAYTIHSPC